MGVANPTTKPSDDFRSRSIILGSATFINLASLVALVVAGGSLLFYLIFAVDWQERPFIGAMLTQGLEVEDVRSFSDTPWAALEAGMRPGDELIGIDNAEWPIGERHQQFLEAMEGYEVGQTVELSIRVGDPENYDNMFCMDTACVVPVVLGEYPLADFLIHFGVGYVMGIVIFFLGLLTVLRRPDLRSARIFSITTSVLAVIVAGRFDLVSTYQLVPIWIICGFMFSALLLSLAMTFPFEMSWVRSVPSLRYMPFLPAAFLTLLTIYLHDEGTNEAALLLPLIAVFFSAIVVVATMLWRRQYSTSPVVREQATFVGGGALIAFLPLVLWVGYVLLSGGQIINWLTPVSQVSTVLFALSLGYAVLQYSLLETDRIIPEFIVYVALTSLLLVGYSLASIGLGWLTSDAIAADSPILIAIAIGAIVMLFNPLYRYLRDNIERLMFRRRRNYQQRLDIFTRKIADAVNMAEIMSAFRSELLDTVSPDPILMFIYDPKILGYRALPPNAESRPATDVIFAAEKGLAKYLMEEQAVLYIEPGQPLPYLIAEDRSQIALLSTPLIMSLRGRERLHGFVAIGAKRSDEAYTYEDLRFVEGLVDQVAFSVERAQIVDDLERRVRIQDVLSQVSRALNFAIDFDTLLELIFAQTSRVIDADQFSIALFDRATEQLYYSFYGDGDDRLKRVEGVRWDIGSDVISDVITKQVAVRQDHFSQEQIRRNPTYRLDTPTVHAWMGVPLVSDTIGRYGGVLGVIAVGSSDPSVTFSEEQLGIFRDIGSIAASAIDKTQLFEKTEARAKQLKAMNDISSQLASELEDVDRLLQTITENAVNILGCEAGSLLLVDEQSNDLVFRVVTGGGGRELIGTHISRSEPSLVADAVNNVRTVIVNDTSKEARWHGDVKSETQELGRPIIDAMEEPDQDAEDGAEAFHARSILTVPLIAQGTAVGALQVLNKEDNSAFNQEDEDLATTFAGQAAVAIQNARLFESQDQQLLARVQELEDMAQIDQSLNQTLLLDQLIEVIMDWALRQTGASAGALFLTVEGNPEMLDIVATKGYPETGSRLSTDRLDEPLERDFGILRRVMDSRSPSLVIGVDTDPDYVETLPGAVEQIAAPVIQGNEVRGAFLIESAKSGVLDLFDMQFLQRLVERASSSIQNALLYSQLQNEQEARYLFVRELTHDLQNPLTSMKGYTDLLLRGMVGELNDRQMQFLKTVQSNADHLSSLVQDMKDMQQIDARGQLDLKLESVRVNEVLEEVMLTNQHAFDEKDQTLTVHAEENLPAIWADSKQFNRILTNFISNANKYTDAGGKIDVYAEAFDNKWDTQGAAKVMYFRVQDDGMGISPEDQKKLGQQYFRSTNQKALDQKGTGLGLALTIRLIDQHGGKFWVESEIGKGTTFHFTIPLAAEILREQV